MQLHAHKCEICEAKGDLVYWLHGDDKKGIEAEHKCPRCGSVQWKKWLVPVAEMPRQQKQPQIIQSSFTESLLWAIYDAAIISMAIILAVWCGVEFYHWYVTRGKELMPKVVRKLPVKK